MLENFGLEPKKVKCNRCYKIRFIKDCVCLPDARLESSGGVTLSYPLYICKLCLDEVKR